MPKRRYSRLILKQKRVKNTLSIKFLLQCLFGLIIFVFLGTIAVFIYFAKDLPNPSNITTRQFAQSTKIYDRTGKILLYDVHGEERRTVVSLPEISPYLRYATISAEDTDFYKHFGIDIKAIVRSFGHNILIWIGVKKGNAVSIEGGSTITQQVIKNALLTREKTFQRKIKEWILAIELELRYPKDKILEIYLNQVPYGLNTYGAEAASQIYFKKSAKDLTIAESALLASLPKAPTYYSPYGSHPEELKNRQDYILKRMKSLGYITEDQYKEAVAEKIKFAPNVAQIKAPHFVMFVKGYLEEQYGANFLETGGLKIYTTLDWKLQEYAQKIVEEGAKNNEKNNGAKNAALVAIDPKTGQVLTMVGSRDYFDTENDGNVNVAIRPRQPGSSFKPIVYTKAFEKGLSPDTVVFDLKTEFNPLCDANALQEKDSYGLDCYHPQNYDGKFRGLVTLRQALAQSLNIPAVKVLHIVGIPETIELAKKMGFTTLDDPKKYGLALVLGGGGVTLLDETAAFSVFANDGIRNPATTILKIEDSEGKTLEEFKPSPETVIDPETVRTLTDVLSDNDARSPIFGAKSPLYFEGKSVAAKTGTAQDFRDAWTVGYTPTITAGVWVGNNDYSPMKQGEGLYVAAPIWHKFMEKAFESFPEESFVKPAPKALPEKAMLNGQIEKIYKVNIDKISGKLATDLTPQETIIEKQYKAIHNILYYVNKDGVLGPEPENPENDPQYKNWEKPVENWVHSNFTNWAVYYEKPPKEYDDIHVKQNLPEVNIISPEDGKSFKKGDAVELNYKASAPLGLKRVVYFLDDEKINEEIVQNQTNQFQFYFTLPNIMEEKSHLITVVAYDTVGNKSEDKIEINIE